MLLDIYVAIVTLKEKICFAFQVQWNSLLLCVLTTTRFVFLALHEGI